MLHAGSAGGSVPGPISRLTGIELLRSIVWYRSKAKIRNIFKRDRSETSTSRLYSGGLPLELVEMIIAHVEPDTQTLKACSGTCRSWYIATLPHLHHTLSLRRKEDRAHGGLMPLQRLDKIRLLPFVKRLHIWHCFLPSEIFNAQGLAYFSALTNIQELELESLDLRSFIPQVQPYLGPFMPRLRSLALIRPNGPHQLVLYLLGLFPNLDDFKLVGGLGQRSAPLGPPLVPQSAPLLRGQLTLALFSAEDFLRDLSRLSGGLRFHYMDLFEVEGSRFLLDSCAETLETLRVHPTRWIESRASILKAFGLSNNRSLRSLEIEVAVMRNSLSYGDGMGFLGDLLSTVTSPVFSQIVIILPDFIVQDAKSLQQLFRAVGDMCNVKPFRLVFWLEKFHGNEYDWGILKETIDEQAAKGGLGPLLHPPVIVSYTQTATIELILGGGAL